MSYKKKWTGKRAAKDDEEEETGEMGVEVCVQSNK